MHLGETPFAAMEIGQASSAQGNVPTLNELCRLCSTDFPPADVWAWMESSRRSLDGVTLRSSNIKQLKDSSKTGCHLCSILLEGILPEKMIATMDNGSLDENVYQLKIQPDSDGWILRISMDLGVKDLLFKQVSNACEEVDADRRTWTLNDANMVSRTRMDALQTQYTTNLNPLAINQIKLWLKSCRLDHKECKRGATKIFQSEPCFRLVDIGTASNSSVHLIDSTDIAKSPKYITLSYRWTDATKKNSLTWRNKEQYFRSIVISDWPPIFTDVMSIAQQLDIRYIWIDSLCIVQDEDKSLNIQDWDQQSVLMDHIYANGVLNLAGVEGMRSLGLSVSRNPLRAAPCVLTCKVGVSNPSLLYWLCWRPDDIVTSIDKAPLSQRGWIFQERLLSKRTVHFGDQLYWECASLRACEYFPLTLDHPNHPEFRDDFIQRLKTEIQRPREQENNQVHNQSLHKLWCSIIRAYSKTQLTKSSDRLIALRGIANSLLMRYNLSNSDYVAGIWKPCLPEQLLWAREGGHGCEDQLLQHFPSWSWASCGGDVRFNDVTLSDMFQDYFIEVISVQGPDDKAHTPDPAQIIIRGRLISLSYKPSSGLRFPHAQTLSGEVRIGDDDNPKDGTIIVELDRQVPLSISSTAILPIYQTLGSCILGLLLGYIGSDNGMATYRRLGIVSCPSDLLENELSFSPIQHNGLTINMERILLTFKVV